ncbi:MAG TPA: c-type cytochrome [Tepidisphaeraceae bacterium]|jgi:mono/diheme cytochrome c family protein/glucose/arabinose dehydrogenase|nr:c-type cytochrome [Tepidisphaeraceae bacterium]
MKLSRLFLIAAGAAPAALLLVSALANNAGQAHHAAATQAVTTPTTKPTADTVEHYPCPPAPNLTPAEELKTFALPPGYKIELVASEPQVEDPVAIAFDGDGRMWVSEMRGYMPDVYAHNEDAPIGRISVLEQTKGDGHYDKATVFLDKLYLPRAVSPVADGVLVATPPHLYFCRGTKGDLHCDQKTEVYGKYGLGRDPEYGDNGLLWARDNWIYSSTSAIRFRYLGDGKFENGPTGHRGQWGISQDDVGRLYFNYNSDQLRGDLIPTEYLSRNSDYKSAGANWQVENDQHTFPSRPNPGINRGYEPGNLLNGRLNTVTATCGPVIFRGTALGDDAYGNAFIPEPAGNLVMRKTLSETNGVVKATGVQYTPVKGQPKLDFLTSTDERFRPVNSFTGPDGALYIVDLYRGLIQHRTYVTPYLRHQVFERGLDQPLHEGRIWRIVKNGATLTAAPKMSKDSAARLVEHLSSANGWWRDTAQRILVERGDVTSIPLLEKLAESGANPLGRLGALWTLSGMGKLSRPVLIAGLHDKDERVCAAAIRLSEPMLADADGKMLGEVLALKNRADVRLQFVLSISGIKNEKVDDALALAFDTPGGPLLRDAALTGLKDRELDFLQLLLTDPAWEKHSADHEATLTTLSSAAFRSGKPATAAELIETAALEKGPTHWRQVAILAGISHIGRGQSKPGKVNLKTRPEQLLIMAEDKDPLTSSLAKSAIAFVHWPGQPTVEKHTTPLTAEQKQSFARGKPLFGAICAQCHQPDGRGFEGKAPSLRDSPIALGPDVRLIRIVLNGAKGEYHVTGWSPNLEMPTLAVLDDMQIADILTYVRHEWDHDAPAVDAATVAKIRAIVGGRQAAWTEEELLAVPAPKEPATRPARGGKS